MSIAWSRVVAVAAALGAVARSAYALPAACTAEEETLFSCSSGAKRIAICASRGWTPTSGYVQYRYGPRAQAELVIPASVAASAPAQAVTVGQAPLAGGGFAYARFTNGKVEYTVYSAISSRWGEKSGVAVDRDGVRIAARRCDRSQPGEFADGLIDRAGLPTGDAHFDLPE